MKKLLSIILSITMLFSVTAVAFTEETATSGAREVLGIIKVGVNAEFPPFEYMENDKILGFDIDLMNYIAARINYGVEFSNMPFDKLIPAVVNGEIDCAISGITITKERESVIDYTRPYIKSQYINDLGEKQVEEYAVVFPDNSKNKARVIEASGDPNFSKYMLVDNAIKELTEDLTIDKLIEKYRLNETTDYTFSAIENSNKDEVSDKEIPKYDTWEEIGLVSPYPSEWANESVIKAQALEILEEDKNYWYKNPITREEFCELIYNVIYNYSQVDMPQVATIPLADTSNEKIRSLYWWRIINGKGTFTQEPVISPDGVVKSYPTLPVIAPKDFLTREEAATIIVRMVNRFFPMAATEMWFEYDDINEVSKWASDSVQTISNLGFMKGTNNNKFAPKETLTIEEAIVILVRVYSTTGISRNDITNMDKTVSFYNINSFDNTRGEEIEKQADGWYKLPSVSGSFINYDGETPKVVTAYFTPSGTDMEQYEKQVGFTELLWPQNPVSVKLTFAKDDTIGHLHYVFSYENGATTRSEMFNVIIEQ